MPIQFEPGTFDFPQREAIQKRGSALVYSGVILLGNRGLSLVVPVFTEQKVKRRKDAPAASLQDFEGFLLENRIRTLF